MNLNLSSQIVLNQVAEEFYNPKTAVEQSEITRFEKLPTDIYPKVEDGAKAIADAIVQEMIAKRQEGKQLILGLGTGQSLTPIFDELIRRHEEGLSFANVTVVNAYEYFPLKPDSSISSLQQLKSRLLDRLDIPEGNILSPDGSVAQNDVQEVCRYYEQRIAALGGIDILLLGIGRAGNIATNRPGSGLTSRTRLILIDATSREEMTMSFGGQDAVPPCSITLGMANIMAARKIFLTAWGEEKAEIIEKTIEGPITDSIPASYLQTHNGCHVVTDLAAAGNSLASSIRGLWQVASGTTNSRVLLLSGSARRLASQSSSSQTKTTTRTGSLSFLRSMALLTTAISRSSTTCNIPSRDGLVASPTPTTLTDPSVPTPTPSVSLCSHPTPTMMLSPWVALSSALSNKVMTCMLLMRPRAILL